MRRLLRPFYCLLFTDYRSQMLDCDKYMRERLDSTEPIIPVNACFEKYLVVFYDKPMVIYLQPVNELIW